MKIDNVAKFYGSDGFLDIQRAGNKTLSLMGQGVNSDGVTVKASEVFLFMEADTYRGVSAFYSGTEGKDIIDTRYPAFRSGTTPENGRFELFVDAKGGDDEVILAKGPDLYTRLDVHVGSGNDSVVFDSGLSLGKETFGWVDFGEGYDLLGLKGRKEDYEITKTGDNSVTIGRVNFTNVEEIRFVNVADKPIKVKDL